MQSRNEGAATHNFSDEVARMLSESGWYSGRNAEKALKLPAGFAVFPAASQILKEFGNLKCGKRGRGIDRARSTLNLDPSLAAGESDRFDPYARLLGARLYPLGEADDGHSFVAIDDKGRVFLVMDFMMFVGEDFVSALETLLLGKRSRPVDEQEWSTKGIEVI